jgi:hypothetical protein
MQRIAFIDHAYHQVTKSANFFVDLLRTRFDVSVYYDGIQSQSFVNDIVMAKFDIIVLWQTEHLAPYFIAADQRVVCIPMYDGAGQAPHHYWHQMRQARHINFCQHLHNHVCTLGLVSLPVQYMKNPADFTPVSDYSTARVVFWQRRPEHGLTAARVRRMIGPDAYLHVHNAPDLASPEQFPAREANTVSFFDLDRNALAEAMDRGNVFVCPRLTEGIGMAMIEAMARGMVIIAHDAPTQNEYVIDGVNGFLVDATQPNLPSWPLDLTTPEDTSEAQKRRRTRKKMRRRARKAAEAARAAWTMPMVPLTEGAVADEWQIAGPPGTWPEPGIAHLSTISLDEDPNGPSALERMGPAARDRAQAMYEDWLDRQTDILDFIEETPRPTGLKISKDKLDFLARETELWHHHPQAFIANMAYWESRGIVLQDRQRLPRHVRKRMRHRRSLWFRGLRVTFHQFKALRNRYRYVRDTIRRRL